MEDQAVPAESIAELADEGQDVSHYFTNDGKLMPPREKVTSSKEKTHELSGPARVPPRKS